MIDLVSELINKTNVCAMAQNLTDDEIFSAYVNRDAVVARYRPHKGGTTYAIGLKIVNLTNEIDLMRDNDVVKRIEKYATGLANVIKSGREKEKELIRD